MKCILRSGIYQVYTTPFLSDSKYPEAIFRLHSNKKIKQLCGSDSYDRCLVDDHHSCDAGTGQGGDDASDECRESDLGHASTAVGSKLGQDTDLDPDGGDVAEAADGVGCDQAGTR